MTRIAFDVGGVLSKYPKVFLDIIEAIGYNNPNVEIHIISDMHPVEKIQAMLELNGFKFPINRVHSANYQLWGENCKAVLCKDLYINLIIDDFPGYVAEGEYARLLMMPHPRQPYYHDDWKTDGSDGDFGRRKYGKQVNK